MLVRALAAIAATAGIIAAVMTGGDRNTARAAANVTIEAHDFLWSPDAVTIQVGDTVTWTDEQGFHNVLLGDARLNQPGFPQDPSWNPPPQHTFTAPGTYTFVCEVHPSMTGKVVVEGSGPTPTPTPTPPPAVPPPGSGPSDGTPPALSAVTVSGGHVELTVSEPATISARFLNGDESVRSRWQVEQGTWTLERPLASGTYTYEVWATDAAGNRSAAVTGEVKVRG
jgi:plastocyanin